jgi:hypothetical protein
LTAGVERFISGYHRIDLGRRVRRGIHGEVVVELGVAEAADRCTPAYPTGVEAHDVEVGSQPRAEL